MTEDRPDAGVSLVVEAAKWRAVGGLLPRLRRAAGAAMEAGGAAPHAALTILLSDDARLRVLNKSFRGKDKPTNVLSFPANGAYLGDIAIAYGVAAREAREQKKRLSDHALHLAVHGVLHLLGYDHETGRDARIMEPLETEILAMFKIADPYARPRARHA